MPVKVPDPGRLRELMDEEVDLDKEVVEALTWLATFLENRKQYHRKQQLKNKIFKQLVQQHGLEDEANNLTNDAHFNEIANSEPDDDDLPVPLKSKGDLSRG